VVERNHAGAAGAAAGERAVDGAILAMTIRGTRFENISTAEGRSVCGAAEETKFAGRAVISLKDVRGG